VVAVAIVKPELSPRELARHITDVEGWFISESSVYRILKSYDLITSPNYIVISAAAIPAIANTANSTSIARFIRIPPLDSDSGNL
jgi:hypothetical protein